MKPKLEFELGDVVVSNGYFSGLPEGLIGKVTGILYHRYVFVVFENGLNMCCEDSWLGLVLNPELVLK